MMLKKAQPKKGIIILIITFVILALVGILLYAQHISDSQQDANTVQQTPPDAQPGTSAGAQDTPDTQPDTNAGQQGQIFLYGEVHSVQSILDKELQLWGTYYADGMRDLFVELSYFTAEFLNIWMQSENDDILDAIFEDWRGTQSYSPEVKQFYMDIKENYPETVFHGTDVGHQYRTTGERFLEYLREHGKEDSEQYTLAQKAIKQGKYYYAHSDDAYRENMMAQNFIREFDKLDGKSVMGIYGAAHTQIDAMNFPTNTVPCMANQLNQHYAGAVSSEDLSSLAYITDPESTEIMQIGGKEYTALYFGRQDLSVSLPKYRCRDFWRLEDAYDDFKDHAKTGDVLPYNNYPMLVEEHQVFVIDYTNADGSVRRTYFRSDGNEWNGLPTTEEFLID